MVLYQGAFRKVPFNKIVLEQKKGKIKIIILEPQVSIKGQNIAFYYPSRPIKVDQDEYLSLFYITKKSYYGVVRGRKGQCRALER